MKGNPVYLRLMRRDSDEERRQLLHLLGTAAGIEGAQIVSVHLKGGYRVAIQLPTASVDPLLRLLEANNWMAVL
jgi:hypothetical protein